MKEIGSEILPKTDTNLSAIRPSDSSTDLRRWVAAELLAMKELIPAKEMSDEAAGIMQALAVDAAQRVGRERFHAALVKAMESSGQFRPTIGTIRRMCGISPRMDSGAEAVAAAWSLVTLTVTRFLSRDGEGNTYTCDRLTAVDGGKFRAEHPPFLPHGVAAAVAALGGWTALADAHPQYWSQRFDQFRAILRLSTEEIVVLTSPASTSLTNK